MRSDRTTVIRAMLAVALGSLLLAGCGASTSPATTAPAPSATPGPAIPLDPGQRFVKDVLSTPGLHTDMNEADLIVLAKTICDAIGTPGITRGSLIDALGTKYGPQPAQILVDAASRSYCPEKTFSTAPAVAYTPPDQAASAAPSGPRTSFSAGTYEVGVDIEPGKYKTTGPTSGNCYWARLRNTSGEADAIIANGNTEGPATVTIAKTDAAFETNGCTWTKAG